MTGRHDNLIHARIKAWLLKQRAEANKVWMDDPILRKDEWQISSGVLLEDNVWRYDASYCENITGDGYYDPVYHATVLIDGAESKVLSIEWANPDFRPEAVLKAPEPPANFGVWS